MGRVLTGLDMVPDHVISSTAVRARTTAALAAEAGGWDSKIDLEPGFYRTGPTAVLETASGAPGVERLMLVGHQPTWSMLVHHLSGAIADMRTASVVEINLMIDIWGELPAAQGVLSSLHHPRPYFGSEWDEP